MGFTIRFMYGGKFYNIQEQLLYRKDKVYVKKDVDPDLLSKIELEAILLDDLEMCTVDELWYLIPGKAICYGLRQILSDADILNLVGSVGGDETCHVYVIQQGEPSPLSLKGLAPSLRSNTDLLNVEAYLGSSSEEEGESSDGERVLGSESSDSDGSDFNFVASDEEDDDIWVQCVDEGVNDNVADLVEGEHQFEAVEDDAISVELEDEEDGFRSLSDSADEHKPKYVDFNPLVDFKRPISLKVGMRFGSNEVFRRALREFAIQQGGDFYYLHNNKTKVSAYCKKKCDCKMKWARKQCTCKKTLCGWRACARKIHEDGTFQLKTFNSNHECGRTERNSKVTSKWLTEKYLEHYRDDPQWRIKGFINTVRRDYTVKISYGQAWRSRTRALLMTQGDARAQYAKVWDYAATLVKRSHGTSAYVKVCLNDPEKPLFQRLYVCLDACKMGFLAGCRPIIGLDGCHLKGAYTGQLLRAVGKDGNENLFPIAYAVVEIENKETWCWFIESLMQDLRQGEFTFISDRQKGLVEALNHVVPTAEMRVCVKHLHDNFKVKFPGKAFKDGLWWAARAANKADFDEAMAHMKGLSEDAHKYLMDANPNTWSRHGFRLTSKSDMQLNNVCESFNSQILQEREKPILSMCESIRRTLMKRFVSKREGMGQYVGVLTPRVHKKLDELKAQSVKGCVPFWGGGESFEVDTFGKTYVVNLAARSCGCNIWDLTGIPCIHAIACCMLKRYSVIDYMHEYYTKDAYLRAYNNVVQTIPGEQQWEKTDMIPPGPPPFVAQPGRPKKLRRRSAGEDKKNTAKRTRSGKPNKCSRCGVEGHTKRKCTNPPKGPEPPRTFVNKGGRPKDPNTVIVSRHNSKKIRSETRLPVPPAIRTAPSTDNPVRFRGSASTAPLPMGAAQSQRRLDDLLSSQEYTLFPPNEVQLPPFFSSAPTGDPLMPTCSTKRNAQSQGQPSQKSAKKMYYPRSDAPQTRLFSARTLAAGMRSTRLGMKGKAPLNK